MKKIFVILSCVVLFWVANLSFAQDCGKCPLKCPAKKVIVEKNAAEPEVYVKKNDEMYHQKTCSVVKEDYTGIKLSEALKEQLKPCSLCKPPVKTEPLEKADQKAKKNT